MTALVLDASIALSWVLDDETTPESDAVSQIVQARGAFAPAHWAVEVANAVVMALRRRRITDIQALTALSDLALVHVELDVAVPEQLFRVVAPVAVRESLTVYDATYLSLALSEGLPLATLDKNLRTACARNNVPVLPRR